MKTTLTVEIEYNPNVTDPEGLASALDRLMETILSTPEILDEYGNPRVGEFFVASPCLPGSGDLRIDAPLFRAQRVLLLKIADRARRNKPYKPRPGDEDLLEGLLNLTDAISDKLEDAS